MENKTKYKIGQVMQIFVVSISSLFIPFFLVIILSEKPLFLIVPIVILFLIFIGILGSHLTDKYWLDE